MTTLNSSQVTALDPWASFNFADITENIAATPRAHVYVAL